MNKETIPFRPLGILKNLLDNLGFQVTHCYEDLIFTEHNAFLLRMEEEGKEVSLFFNIESEKEKRIEIAEIIADEGATHSLNITRQGTYRLIPNGANDTLDIEIREYDF